MHGVSDAGIEIQHYLSCDGFNAIMPSQYGILTLRNWRVSGVDGVIPGRYNGNYGAQEELSGWLADSGNVVLEVLQDGDFALEGGELVNGLDPRPSPGQTVTPHYMDLDDRLEVTSYHGAFHPVLEPWFAGWSTLDGLGLFSGEVALTEGCTYDFACNYDPLALVDDGSCERASCAGVHLPTCVQLRSGGAAGRRVVHHRGMLGMHMDWRGELRPGSHVGRRDLSDGGG